MLTFINRLNLGGVVARSAAICALALAATLFHPNEARAQWTTSGTNTTTTNNVGVGTTAPQTSVHVSTNTTSFVRGIISEQTSADSNSALFFFRKHRAGTAVQNGDNLGSIFATPFDGTNFVNSARLRFAVDGAVASGSVPTAIQFMTGNSLDGVERMRITSSGLVGVGTAAPTRALSVESTVAPAIGFNTAGVERGTLGVSTLAGNWFTGTAVGDTSLRSQANDLWIGTYSASKPIRFVTNDTQRLIINGTGNVGIGTNTPGVVNGVNFAAYLPVHVQTPGGGAGSIAVDSSHSSSGLVINDSSQPLDNRMWSISQGAGGGKLTFAAHTDVGTATNRVVIDRAGKVGIGTAAPTTALDVVGDIRVTGNINAKYQDLAEWVPSTQKLAAGTVVILDVARDNHVAASVTSYDTRVAGVISAQPGIALGEAGDGKVLVATTGRVKVRVDANQGPINVGDLLVTSDRQGYAMKSEPVLVGKRQMHAPGTIIGKALESLAGGTGEILVLLSLQ